METMTLTATDGYELSLQIWVAEEAKGCVQILHGMEEHKERYERFARYLSESGFTVVLSDMRGHGRNAPFLGFFSERDGWELLLSDQKQITAYIRERFGVEKVYLFAHSMGTIIARNLLQTESVQYEKVVLEGYPNDPGKIATSFGIFLCNVIGAIRGQDYYSLLIQKLGVGRFIKSVENPKTASDWISFDEENVKAYLEDPYCGRGFRVSAFRDLFLLVRKMSEVKKYENVCGTLPILMICGENDPCTGFEKGRKKSVRTLRDAGFHQIQTKVYPHMRHELLNDKGKKLVMEDILRFFCS